MEIDEEKLKEILKEQRKEFQNYIGAISEDFKSEIKIVAETLSDLQKQLLAIREMVAKNTEDIEIMKIDIQFIKQDLKQKVDRDEFNFLEKRVLALESKSSIQV
jgi:flagellar capping protein FliD